MSNLPSTYPIVQARQLKKHFPVGGGRKLVAIDNLDLELFPGKTVALVGESGSGKSTVARCLTRLINPNDGKIFVHGKSITELSAYEMSHIYRHMQMVFQDPNASLNPRMTVRQVLEEPLKLHLNLSRQERANRVRELVGMVGLTVAHLDRYPHELSGGQRQRIGIARAISVRPEVVLLDEPTASLDVSVRGQILDLLARLQKEFNLAYLFISHDLQVVRYVSDEVAVMYLGVIVERGPTDEVFRNPRHPYTQALLSAAPVAQWGIKRERTRLKGEVGSPIDPPDACRLVGRCPLEQPSCAHKQPQLYDLGDGRSIACPIVAPPPPSRQAAEPGGAFASVDRC
jgi:oligopeptide/dipeptide ABC transporter ATP-binding protein